MSKTRILLGLAALSLLAACEQKPPAPGTNPNGQTDPYAQAPNPNQYSVQNPGQNPNNPGQNPWPGNTSGPAPYNPSGPGMMAPNPEQMPNPGTVQPSQPLNLKDAPKGMNRLNSQSGYVFRQTLNGQGAAPQQGRAFYDTLVPWFDAPPQVMGHMDDPSGRMSQVGFAATKGGAPVMAMLTTVSDANGRVTATLFIDSPDRFQNSMQAMMAAAQTN